MSRDAALAETASPWRADLAVLAAFATVASALFVLAALNVRYLDFAPVPPHAFPDKKFFEGWTRWDTGWYYEIARNGYSFAGEGVQSTVAFFPAYPTAMRAVGALTGDVLAAGVVVTLASGAAAVVLFRRWCASLLGSGAASLGTALLLVSPFAFYLYGAVYSDALFLAAALAAFVLLERDRPLLAGVAGAVATAARPVGVAVVIALVIRALERRGVLDTGTVGARLRRIRVKDTAVLASLGGIGAYSALLWWRFERPLAFAQVGAAPGWDREFDWHTISKQDLIELFSNPAWSPPHLALGVQSFLTIAALALTLVVKRHLGWGYAAYNVVAVALPAVASKDLIGMGRYVLVAFPTFAAAGYLLGRLRRPLLLVGGSAILVASAAALVLMHSYFVRWYFFS